MIIFATLSPDMAFPGSGVIMQDKMGFLEDVPHFVPCLDIRNQCSGLCMVWVRLRQWFKVVRTKTYCWSEERITPQP